MRASLSSDFGRHAMPSRPSFSLRSNCMLAQRARMFSPPRFWTRTGCSLFELACWLASLEQYARSLSSHVLAAAAILDSNCMLAQRARMLARFARTVCSLFELACSRPKGLEPPLVFSKRRDSNPLWCALAFGENKLRKRASSSSPKPENKRAL
jgi:hypothetical protein